MHIRLAKENDLPALYEMYQKMIEDMNHHGINIWDELYPCSCFAHDIALNRLYIMEKQDHIVSAFCITSEAEGEPMVQWQNQQAKAVYLDRLGVAVEEQHTGLGSYMIDQAAALALQSGAEYLRLFVVDLNLPAIHLYEKKGFVRAKGIYTETFDDLVLNEYGFEKKLKYKNLK